MNEKITITTNEYEELKKHIHNLELEISVLDKKKEALEEKEVVLREALNYLLNDISSMERIFQWKKIIKAVKEHLNNK